ncbi:hypothetical protein PVL29_011846 [Vitis rotundifolia]|uniref:Uncharacterized protein n=1 Tax=Vitis rotundifolia TaxID=103349 RepID=A0AA38ZR81_VITRO|nr:hypothetical protein PVL29_011846 [Vitis rotundifolia]
MGGGGDFTVTLTKKVVAAMLPMQEHWLPLSNLNLLLPPLDVSVFFCYKNPHDQRVNGGDDFTFGSMIGVLNKAISPEHWRPIMHCQGKLWAHADVRLEDLDLYNPDVSIEGKLVPKKNGVLSVQVTISHSLCISNVVLVGACTFDHRIADAYSANMFLVSWAEMAQSKPLSVVPSFRRSLLNIRRLGSYDPSLDDMYVPISALPPPRAQQPGGADPLISRIYYVMAEQLSLLQMLATSKSSSYKRTKIESFSAFLWKMVAKSAVGENDNKKICKMGIVMDRRMRLSSGDEDKAAVMATYFANVLSIPFGEKMIDEPKVKPFELGGRCRS